MDKPYVTKWKRYLLEQSEPIEADDTIEINAFSPKKALVKDLQQMLSSMDASNEHDANLVAEIIVNRCNDFLSRQKDFADVNKYGPALYKRNELKYLQ